MSILQNYIEHRVKKRNKNFVIVFVGATGSGKSYSALKLAQELDPNFNINNCCFEAIKFMERITVLTNPSSNTPPGTVIMWDEFGVEHSAREFMTISNRVINYFFQTSRHYNLIVIMTVPLLSFIDSATRKLTHAIAEMKGIDMSKKLASVKVKMNQVNVISGKEYPKYLRYRKDGRGFVSKTVKFGLPDSELLEQYEKKKKAFTSKLNRDIMMDLLRSERKKKTGKPLTPLQEEIVALFNQGIKQKTEIARTLGKDVKQIWSNIEWIKNKGYFLGESPI